MPVATFPEYIRDLEEALNTVLASGEGVLLSLQMDQRSAIRGFIAGSLQFHDGSTLSFREFIDLSRAEPRLMYAYHERENVPLWGREDANLLWFDLELRPHGFPHRR